MVFDFSDYVRIEIPEGRVKKITDGSGRVIWSAGYVNQVPLSTTEDGKTIYNTTGYKYPVRIRSGGAEGTGDACACTGFIPAQGGDIIRVSGCKFSETNNGNAINVSDASFANIGQIVGNYAAAGYGIFAASVGTYEDYTFDDIVEESTGVWKWTVPPGAGIEYIRVTGHQPTGNGASLIVTVNEEIN